MRDKQKVCNSCGKKKDRERSFYLSHDPLDSDGRVGICKDCVMENVDVDNIESVKSMLLRLNRPFLLDRWNNSLEEGRRKKSHPFGLYMKNISLNANTRSLTFLDTDDKVFANDISIKNIDSSPSLEFEENVHMTEEDLKNKEYVINSVGYDPFETENETDKKYLYNKLADFLDDSTLEDNFKLLAVIEIVKTFNQVNKINYALSQITSNAETITSSVGQIKSLFQAKESMLTTVLKIAKDNGISENHNNKKSKGAGTLSGIIKQLHEIGLETAEINLFDIETATGMKQVADISNKSIMEQLSLNENDYTEMIKEQREVIIELQNKVDKLEEENRLLKIKLKEFDHLKKNDDA